MTTSVAATKADVLRDVERAITRLPLGTLLPLREWLLAEAGETPNPDSEHVRQARAKGWSGEFGGRLFDTFLCGQCWALLGMRMRFGVEPTTGRLRGQAVCRHLDPP